LQTFFSFDYQPTYTQLTLTHIQPIDLNRAFHKVFSGTTNQEGAASGVEGEEKEQTPSEIVPEPEKPVSMSTVVADAAAVTAPTRPPTAPSFNFRAVAAKRKAAAESLLRLREVHRKKAELYGKLTGQLKELLQKVQMAKVPEVKKKLLVLVKKVDASVKSEKAELEELSKKITEMKLKGEEEQVRPSKAFASPTAIQQQKDMTDSSEFHRYNIASQANSHSIPSILGPAGEDEDEESHKVEQGIPTTPRSQQAGLGGLEGATDRKKLFRVVHVAGCPVELQEELIVHMESFGDLFDYDITSRTGPAVFTYRGQADAQRVGCLIISLLTNHSCTSHQFQAVNEAAATFPSASPPLKVTWAPAALGQEGVIPDRERRPGEQMTPKALLASIDYEDEEEDSEEDGERKSGGGRRTAAATAGGVESEEDD